MNSPGHSKVLQRLARFRRALKWVQVQRAWGLWLGLLPLHVLILAVMEHLGDHSTESRRLLQDLLFAGFGLWAAGLLVPVVWHFGWRRALPDDEALASRLGWGSDEIRDRLLNALQLQKGSARNAEGYDPDLLLASLDKVLPALETHEDRLSLPLGLRRKALKTGVILAMFWLVIGIAGGRSSFTALQRILQPDRDFRQPAGFALQLVIDRPRVIQGEPVSIEVVPTGRSLPDGVVLFSRTGSDKPLGRELELQRGRARLEGLTPSVDTRFWATSGDVHSDTLELKVLVPPMLRELRIAFQPPAYTGLPREELPEGLGEIHCPVGSRIEVQGRLSEVPVMASLEVTQGERTDHKSILQRFGMDGDSLAFKESFIARADGSYALAFLDSDSLAARGDTTHDLVVLPDQPPVLRVLEPVETEARLDRDLVQNLLAAAEDDYGISRLRLVHRISSGLLAQDETLPDPALLTAPPEGWKVQDLPFQQLEPRRVGLDYRWDLASAGLLPDDRIHFYLEVFDNDGWNGAKSVRSSLYTLKVPGMEELYAEVEEDQGDLAAEAEEILEETRENSERLQQLSQELRRNPEPTWEQKQKLSQLAQRQQELTEEAAKTSEKLEQLQQKLELNNLVSEELKQKFQRLNELLKEAINPELMEKLKQAAEKAQAPNQPAKSQEKGLKDMQEMLKEMERQMEQFLSVLEEMRMQQKLEEFGRRLMEMADRQQQVGEDLEQRKGPELARDEQALKKDFEQLQQEVQDFRQEFADNPNLPAEQLEQFKDQVAEQQPQAGMQQLSQQLEQGETGSQNKQKSDKVEMQLESLAAQMQKASQEASQNAKKELAREIDRICQELLVLSHQQERVNGENPGLDARSARLPLLAEKTQENRLGVAACADAVAVLSQRSFMIPKQALALLGNSLGGLDKMLLSYEERSLGELQRSGPNVLGTVNQTILVLKESKAQMQNAKSASGFEEMMEQLAQASSSQQCLNGQCSKLMSSTPGGSQKPMSISFGDAASQQAELRQQMESLSEKLGQEGPGKGKGEGKSGKGEGEGEGEGEEGKPQPKPGNRSGDFPGENGVLGDLGQAASDMKEVEQDLLNQQYTERTRKLQERILTRLLEAQQSVRRQDFSEKRQSRTASPLRPVTPAELKPERDRGMQQDLLRALREGYTPDYEKLIRDYFRALEVAADGVSTQEAAVAGEER